MGSQRSKVDDRHEGLVAFEITGPTYWHAKDEAAFFKWLRSIDGVVDVVGVSNRLKIIIDERSIAFEEIKSFVALFRRYDINRSALRKLLTPENTKWFCDPHAYWYDEVFSVAEQDIVSP
jgi:hypothetical protein